jgi:hypothetical protein
MSCFSFCSNLIANLIYVSPAVDPQKWLQTPEPGLHEQFDDDSLSTNGWLPVESLGGIDCKKQRVLFSVAPSVYPKPF